MKFSLIMLGLGLVGVFAMGVTPARYRMVVVYCMAPLGVPFIVGFFSTLGSYFLLYWVRFPLAIWAAPLLGAVAGRLKYGEWNASSFLGGLIGYCAYMVFSSPYEASERLRTQAKKVALIIVVCMALLGLAFLAQRISIPTTPQLSEIRQSVVATPVG